MDHTTPRTFIRLRSVQIHAVTSDIQRVDEGDEYIHVRFRDPDEFDEIRTPDWAREVAESISTGAEVRTGRKRGSDEWTIESVLIKKNVGTEKAKEQARKIFEKIEL